MEGVLHLAVARRVNIFILIEPIKKRERGKGKEEDKKQIKKMREGGGKMAAVRDE